MPSSKVAWEFPASDMLVDPGVYTHSAKGPWNKSLNFIFPIKYVIPKSLKVGHSLSEYRRNMFYYGESRRVPDILRLVTDRCFKLIGIWVKWGVNTEAPVWLDHGNPARSPGLKPLNF